MIERTLQPHLIDLAGRYPVVTVTGPRQSGKTTLCRMAFPDKPYVSLEPPTEREYALDDPLGFLARFRNGAVIDEVQRAPDLLSYIQSAVDEDARPGRFILTGSQNLGLMQSVTQSLAGRTALIELMPLGLEEIRRFADPPQTLYSVLWTGGYPRIYERNLPPDEWLAGYTTTYVERDVRQIHNVGDLLQFQTFLRLCAGRTGCLLNLSSLGSDCGVSHTTVRSWLSVLEASYIAFRLPPYHSNLGKRLTKTPKLYFYDTGLVCSLLGIEKPEQLETHPLRGFIFETWVISELAKQFLHQARRPRFYFYQDRTALEVDLLIERGASLTIIEIKSGQTPSSGYFSALESFHKVLSTSKEPAEPTRKVVVYGGMESQDRSRGTLLSWSDLPSRDF